jgi:hypothetical protein
MIYSVIDIEADGLLYATHKAKQATKIHCLCYKKFNNGIEIRTGYITSREEMINFLIEEGVLVGHNIIRYDIPLLEKLLGIKITAKLIDTLGLSWYLYPKRTIHGLEEWGKDFDIQKPPVVDWENSPIETYIFRCSEDVRINTALFNSQSNYLRELYGTDKLRIMMYLSYKLECAREAEAMRWRLDEIKCHTNLITLEEKLKAKRFELELVMPTMIEYKTVSKPDGRYYKKDGTISKAGEKWEEILLRNNLPLCHIQDVRIEASRSTGNPNSTDQLKEWLNTLGWKPETFKYVKESDGHGKYVQRPIPQIMADDDSGVCPSIKKLFKSYPYLANLEEYSVLKHRIGLLKGFIRDASSDGYLQAEIRGFTNTLRFQHKTIVNLPQIPKKYWQEIRECLIAPTKDHELCGSDMSGLEDLTGRHYIFFFDPKYVEELNTPGFDPHLDIALLAGLLTKKQVEEHKLYDSTKGARGVSQKPVRLKAKKVNYACKYGAGPAKLSVTANIPLKEAGVFHTVYWKRNHAVKKVANGCKVKTVMGQKWLYNPVSQFWLSLREEKDKFSTLNQSTGVYCFDTWVRYVRQSGAKLCGQFHDEVIFPIRKVAGGRETVTAALNTAINKTNAALKLNVPLAISIAFGNNYAEIH